MLKCYFISPCGNRCHHYVVNSVSAQHISQTLYLEVAGLKLEKQIEEWGGGKQ